MARIYLHAFTNEIEYSATGRTKITKKNFSRAVKGSLAAIFALASVATYLEATGYNDFDRNDGSNPICALDKSCRPLTPGEIEAARQVFGDNIDYARVQVFDRSNHIVDGIMVLFGAGGGANAPNGNIYFIDPDSYRDDFSEDPDSLALFLHEMTHVWQHQKGGLAVQVVREYLKAKGNYDSLYDYDIEDTTPFADMGVEQQAEIIEHYLALRRTYDQALYKNSWTYSNCAAVRQFEEKIMQELPVSSLAVCAQPKQS